MPKIGDSALKYLLIIPAAVWVAVFLGIPLVLLVVVSFFVPRPGGGYMPGFTLDNYQLALSTYFPIIQTTVIQATEMVCITLVLAYPMAYFMALKVKSVRRKTLVLMLLIIPFWIDWNARTLAWFPILGRDGFINFSLKTLGLVNEPIQALLFTRTSMFLVWIQTYILFMVTPIYLALVKLDPTLLDAAKMLGAPPHKAFYHVTLKLSLPGIIVGIIFIFISVLGDSATPAIFGGGISTVGSVVQALMVFLYFPEAAAIGTVLTVITFVTVYIIVRFVDIKSLIW